MSEQKPENEWRVERWEDQDLIITGFRFQHPGVFSRREADMIVAILKAATPLIQAATTTPTHVARLDGEG